MAVMRDVLPWASPSAKVSCEEHQRAGPQYEHSCGVDSGLGNVTFPWQDKRLLYGYTDRLAAQPWVVLMALRGAARSSGQQGSAR